MGALKFEEHLARETERSATSKSSCDKVRLINAASVKPEAIDWLWEGFLARGKFHLIAGTPEAGKTTIAMGLAAAVSTGEKFPDGSKTEKGSVLIWSGEDGLEDTIVPRLLAAAADLERINIIDGVETSGIARPFDPSKDMASLSSRVEQLGDVKLLIIDPVTQAVANDAHKGNDVRRDLAPLVDLGMKHGVAIIGITHFAKGTAGREPLERVIGSVAFGALARIVLVAAKDQSADPEGSVRSRRVFVRAKSNIGPSGNGFSYAIEERAISDGIKATHVVWGEQLEGTSLTLLNQAEQTRGVENTAITEACNFLREALSDGPLPAKTVKTLANAAGVSLGTLARARNLVGVEAKKVGFNENTMWEWSIPA
jgi:putative DNA primase/helicase